MNHSELYVSLDIGTSTTKVVIGEMLGESLNVIGVGDVKSNGLRKGSIVDIDETVQSIRKAVEQAELMVGVNVSNVLLGINSTGIQLANCQGVVAVSSQDHEITNDDVLRVLDASKVLSIPPEREIVNVIPTAFTVDGVDEIQDPRGMLGVRLEMEGNLITGGKTGLHNLARCVEKANLNIVDFCLQTLGASAIALSREEKELGVVLVDMGGGTTTVSYYVEGGLVKTSVIPVGGDNVTKDLSTVLKTTLEDAEKLKLKYGHAFARRANPDEVIDLKILGSEDLQQFTQVEIADIIEARMEEIFFFIQEELRKMGIRQLPSGIVFTGGGAMLAGVADLAQDIFGIRPRIYFPELIGVRDPRFTNAVGMISFAHHYGKLIGEQFTSRVRQEKVEKRNVTKSVPKPKQKPVEESQESVGGKVKKVLQYFWD